MESQLPIIRVIGRFRQLRGDCGRIISPSCSGMPSSTSINLHKFLHNFRDTVNPMCPTNDGIEDVEHFLLLCPSFEMQRRDFLAGVSELLRSFVQIDTLPNNVLIECLLYGDKNLTDDVNRSILELTLEFIHRTGRFD